MERPGVPPQVDHVVSMAIGLSALVLAAVTTMRLGIVDDVPRVRVFDVARGEGLHGVRVNHMLSDPNSARTVWETIDGSKNALHAGLERVEVGAHIPSHSHNTEEIVLVYGGQGAVYDDRGREQEMTTGTMVHIAARSKHAIRNTGQDPLWLLWCFPSSSKPFQFQQDYITDSDRPPT